MKIHLKIVFRTGSRSLLSVLLFPLSPPIWIFTPPPSRLSFSFLFVLLFPFFIVKSYAYVFSSPHGEADATLFLSLLVT